MPIMDGFDAARRIIELDHVDNKPLIFALDSDVRS
jgi:hypothetical protein